MGNTTATPNTPQTTEQTQLLWGDQKNTLEATTSARIKELEEQLKWERLRANTFQQILISACSNNQETAERYGVVLGYPSEDYVTNLSSLGLVSFADQLSESLELI